MGHVLEATRAVARGEPWRTEDSNQEFLFGLFPKFWLMFGLPHVEMSHAMCASLIATTVPGDVMPWVRLPWLAFAISIPDKILPMPRSADGGNEEFARVAFVRAALRAFVPRNDSDAITDGKAVWTWHVVPDGKGEAVCADGVLTDQLLSDNWDDNDAATARFNGSVGRLIVNTCLRMSDPRHFVHASKPKSGNGKRDGRDSPIPTRFDTFRLIGDVKVDVRKAVTEYVRHGGKSPTVQSMVRGHWKHQTHGPGGTQRKLIHVEPYWRGPEDAPIAIRSHVVEASE